MYVLCKSLPGIESSVVKSKMFGAIIRAKDIPRIPDPHVNYDNKIRLDSVLFSVG